MIYRIRYTKQALLDMDMIWDGVYEVSGDVDLAERYIDGLIAAISKKKDFPFSGIPLTYRGLFTGFYLVNYKKYQVFYRVREQEIEVIRVLLLRMDYMMHLFGREISND